MQEEQIYLCVIIYNSEPKCVVRVCLCYSQIKIYIHMILLFMVEDELRSLTIFLRKEAALSSVGAAVDTSVLLARWLQGECLLLWLVLSFSRAHNTTTKSFQ